MSRATVCCALLCTSVCLLLDVMFLIAATQFNRYKGSIYLVFEFCEHDLAGLLSNVRVKFTLAEIKKVMQMMLNGLYYIHRNKVGYPSALTMCILQLVK